MKKLLIASNLILLSIILMGFYQQKKMKNPQVNKAMLQQCKICDHYPNDELPGVVGGDVVHDMSDAYSRDKGKSDITGTGQKDALSLVFEMKKVKKFIWLIEKNMCGAHCKKEIGIRFYYIKYTPEALAKLKSDERQLLEKNLNKHSLAMVPVYKENNGEWYDFNYDAVDTTCNFHFSQLTTNKPGAALISISADNHGGVGPPPGTGIFPTTP